MTRLRWAFRFPVVHRIVHRLFPRPYMHEGMRLVSCPMCAWVWRQLESDPAFVAGLEQGRRDHEEGRFTRYVHRDGQLVREDTGEPLE